MYTPLKELISGSEDKLIDKLLVYSKEREYTKYTSTLREAWRVSIEGLSNAIIDAIDIYGATPELSPDEDDSSDPIAAFGIKEAKLHRERGVELSMFLGLMKYYRQIYLDLIADMEFTSEIDKRYELFVHRVFDRIEIGFCTEWSNLSETVKMDELQEMNRLITNEKNKYLTIFTSFANPVILYDRNHKIENVNLPAADLLRVKNLPVYYIIIKIPPILKIRLGWKGISRNSLLLNNLKNPSIFKFRMEGGNDSMK